MIYNLTDTGNDMLTSDNIANKTAKMQNIDLLQESKDGDDQDENFLRGIEGKAKVPLALQQLRGRTQPILRNLFIVFSSIN